ncbi:hypothetical protein [Aeromicrobium chenweiae]|uniref:Uncharacterized protein n=1 Tax=Aeromicrobium chenweiae TaxID=2079793 RepID=A0A2S0WIC8_9ACTN|nr:hypothetical protein [Aeromicrobium chenweiae]AWB91083.1 hypothetical protein C3E78_01960 [Aeromicrobium chenweiae]TGN31986.1 hypothetical protein E4L97_11470 [Aeromicrobium chenweiae]
MFVRRPTAAPLSLADLAALTQEVADDVRAGLHEVHADAESRWHVRLRCDDQVDVWLISWTEDQGTQLHDHAYSPPLTRRSYYDVEGHQLTRLASVWTDNPEAPAPELRAAS